MRGYKQFGYIYLMKFVKQLFDFYLNASVHVALSVYCLLRITAILNDIELNSHLTFFLFFGTISCYSFIKYGVEAEKYILVSNSYHRSIQVFSILCLIVSAYHGIYLQADSWIILVILILLTGLYAIPVLPQVKNLRNLGWLKIVMVALVWAGVTVVLPITEIGQDLNWDNLVSLVQRILLVLVLLIPFEIRDMAYDKPELNTIPQRIGVTKTKVFGAFLVLVYFFLTFLKDEITPLELISKGLIFLALGVMIYVTKRNQSKYYASFWVEAIPVFWLCVVLVLNYFS